MSKTNIQVAGHWRDDRWVEPYVRGEELSVRVGSLSNVADLYVERAEGSLNARLVGDRKQSRAESYGVLRALEALVGLTDACLLIEAAVERAPYSRSAGALLYDFWKIDRPRGASDG